MMQPDFPEKINCTEEEKEILVDAQDWMTALRIDEKLEREQMSPKPYIDLSDVSIICIFVNFRVCGLCIESD
jgi:hypothetical protein